MSPTPPLKRRRLSNSSALSKPFKSPFKTPLKSTDKPIGPSPLQEPTTTDSTPTITKPKLHLPPTSSPPKPTSPSNPSSPSKPSPELLALRRRRQATLQSTLSTARSELDTYAQALKIETSNKDAELEALIRKWRTASKDAAEEVFRGVRDRVNRMGGVKGWREAERKKKEGFGGTYGWAEEEGKKAGESGDEEGNEDGGQGEEVGEAEARDARDGIEEDERREREEEAVDEEGGFTMDMMLKSLNIELDVIGFDKEGQRWVH